MKNQSINSEELQDVIKAPPNWVARWGISAILICLLILLVGSYLYKYPDIVTGNITITTINPPISIVAKASGKIQSLFVIDKQSVKKNDQLLLIESSAKLEDVLTLKEKIDSLNIWIYYPQKLKVLGLPNDLSLGSLQEHYSNLLTKYYEYEKLIGGVHHELIIHGKKKQLKLYDEYLKNFSQQNAILSKEIEVTRKQFTRDSLLHSTEVISDVDFEHSIEAFLHKQYVKMSAETSLSSLVIRITELNVEITEMEGENKLRIETAKISLVNAINVLLSEIKSWTDHYLISAPIDGKITLNKFWSVGQNIIVGETVITVVPHDSTEYFVRAETTMINAGKVKPGLKVNIKLFNFPYLEYGVLKGTVTNISDVPDNGIYYIGITLNNGLNTTSKKRVAFSQKMSGTAEIITKDKRIINRLFDPVLTVLKEAYHE